MNFARGCTIALLSLTFGLAYAAPLAVMVSIPPQAYLVERIGGNRVAVTEMVRPGDDPHVFEPSPQQMMLLAQARLYFTIGLPFETVLLERIQGGYPNLRVVDSTAGVARRMMQEHHHDHADHAHDETCTDAEGTDPHVWLTPAHLSIMAENIARAISEMSPSDATFFEENLQALRRDLDAADASIRDRLAPFKGRAFYVFHPAFGYFAEAYGLEQKAVEVEGKSPSPRQLQRLIAEAREHDIKTIFAQPQFDAKSAETIAQAIGGEVKWLNDLARDVIENLNAMADSIASALSH